MRKTLAVVIVAVVVLGGFVVFSRQGNTTDAASGAAGPGAGGRAGGRGARPPMPVEFATAKRAPLSERVLVVGNLIGAATVQAVPKINGRLRVHPLLAPPFRSRHRSAYSLDG